VLRADRLVKRYGGRLALDQFCLQVAAGEIVGLVGSNGAGKTTFVEVVTGLVRPEAGALEVGGIDALSGRLDRALVGAAPQEQALYPPLTVRQHLHLFGALSGMRRAGLKRAVDATLGELGLEGVADRRAGLLSGGQRRRCQTACALVASPPLLMLDEPTVGADPETRRALLQAVTSRATAGAAVVYTTHYLAELEELGATLAVVSSGRVIARGSQAELLSRLPCRLRVSFSGGVPEGARRHGTVVGDDLTVLCSDPAAALARLVADAPGARSIEMQRPTVEDLYSHLAVGHAA